MSELAEPKARYRRIVDRYECPMCGSRLGERSFDTSGRETLDIYVDSGPTYYRDVAILPKVRTFKPCGCQSTAALPVPAGVSGEEKKQ